MEWDKAEESRKCPLGGLSIPWGLVAVGAAEDLPEASPGARRNVWPTQWLRFACSPVPVR